MALDPVGNALDVLVLAPGEIAEIRRDIAEMQARCRGDIGEM